MELILVGVFFLSAAAGYIVIKKVPSMLHTPLMSGMNALSGITVAGALAAVPAAGTSAVLIISCAAAFLAVVNISGGFLITHRMLRMFGKREDKADE